MDGDLNSKLDQYLGGPSAPKDAGVLPSTLPTPAAPPPSNDLNSKLNRYLPGGPEEAAEPLRQSMRIGSAITPEIAARVLDVEKKSGLPRRYVEQNLDELERAVALKSFDPMHFRQTSPKFAAWLAGDPHALAVAKKDIALMGPLEKLTASVEAGWANASPRLTELYGKELEGKKLTAQETVEMAVLKKRHETAGLALDRAPTIPWLAGQGAYAWRQFTEQLPPVLAGLAGGSAIGAMATMGRSPAAIYTGAKAGGLVATAIHSYNLESASAWGEFKDVKDVTGKPLENQDLARGAARAYGVASALIETGSDAATAWGMSKLIPGLDALKQKLGVGGAKAALKQATREMLTNPTKRAVFLKMSGGIAGASMLEGLEEYIQTFLQAGAETQMKARSGQIFTPTDWGKVQSEALDAAKSAAAGSLFIAGPAAGMGVRMKLQQVARAEESQKFFQALGETMSQSDMVKNAPDVAESAVAAITADSGVKNVYVPVQAWDAMFQADARGAAQEILGDTTQYDEAKGLTGADLVIPIEKYAARVAGTPLHEKLSPDLRLEQGGLSQREAEEVLANTDALLKLHAEDAQAAAEKNAPLAEIQKEMYDMVRPFMGEREASRAALLQSQRYAIRAARTGQDVMALWKAEAPIVKRDFAGTLTPEALASQNNFAEYQRGNMLTTTGQAWAQPGDELNFYHGGNPDIVAFRPRQAGAVFLSLEPATASEFAMRWGARDEAGAVYKVYATARKPFDFENAAHVDDIAQALEGVTDREIAKESASQSLRGFYTSKARLLEDIAKGSWGAIEHPAVQRVIKSKRYDAFWVMEEGVKNIGIYDPKNIKSATGNRGTFDTTKDNILYQTLPTAIATNVGAALNVNNIRLADLATSRQDPQLFEKLANAIVEETGMKIDGDPVTVIEAAIERMTSNLLWLHDLVPAPVAARSRLWYDGAQEFAARWAIRWGKSLAQAAGMLATLSPQKDWFMNATMGERVGDILDTQMEFMWSDRMNAAAFKFLAKDIALDTPTANKTAYELVRGKTLAEVVATNNKRAIGVWIRAYDEAYNSSAHAIISPEGQFQGNVMTGQDIEARRAWGDFTAIGKAASIFIDGSAENISRQIGNAHKVRNFYNNIFNASDPRFTTIDTHAVAAAHLRAFSGSDPAVVKNFGAGGKSSVIGIYGTYPIYYEAYRRAALARGLLPREMQSITWEAVRAMFPDTFKTAKNKKAVDKIWSQVDAGKLTVARARNLVKRLALGEAELPAPEWFAGRVESHLLRERTYTTERAPMGGIQIDFEVAPDPRNEALVDRWNALPQESKQRLSVDVAWNIVAKAMAVFDNVGLKGELHTQLGGWAGATNPSFGLRLDRGVSAPQALRLARLLGYALKQEAMSVVGADKFVSSEKLGALVIAGVDDLNAHGIYQTLRDAFGADAIQGHTTAAGNMIVLMDEEQASTLGPQVAQLLGDEYTVTSDTLYGSMLNGEDDYGLSRETLNKGNRAGSSLREVGDQLRREAAAQVEAYLRQSDPDAPGAAFGDVEPALRQEDSVNGFPFSRDGSRRDQGRSYTPLAGAPTVKDASGPDPVLVAVAEQYARNNGIRYARQAEYVQVDPERAKRLAAAYEAMPHAPTDPAVQEAYADLARQVRAQYDALVTAGYEFTFFDSASDPYAGNPWNAMRDLRANKRMAVYGTYDGFGTEGVTATALADNPMLADTGLQWPDADGIMHTVTVNDLFRAVHDAFGHGMEGAGFRGQGEENAWQAHARLFTGPALGALTSETRGQNSWLNYGPYGEANQTAKVEDTVFAEQKTGLMPPWTWEEGRAADMPDEPLSQKQGPDTRPTVRGQFERAPAGQRPLITLFRSANPSTILHELGHSWLEELRRDAEGPHSTPQLKADWEFIKTWSGMGDLAPDAPIPRAAHELFARNVEAYFRTGQAPSIELRSVFSQFAEWLKKIYRTVRDLIGEDEIHPEFRKVMDRMLATDEQIAAAQAEAGYETTALPTDELTAAEAAEYQKKVTEVRLEAEERVRAEAMNEVVRERTDWWRAEKALVTREVEAEVNARPEYNVASWLRTGRLLDGSEVEGLQHARLDRQALVYQYGKAMLPKLAFMLQAQGGHHPDVVAQAFGYDTGDAMLRAVTEAQPRRQVIAAEVDRRMMETHGDMLNDGGLAEKAIEAVHSNKQADVLLTELRILKRMGAKGELTTLKAVQTLAAQVVSRKMVGDLKPGRYISTGAKAGYEAERAMIGKDYTHAFDSKLQQLMNLALTQEIVKRKAEVDKALRMFKLLDRPDEKLAKSRDLNLVNTARAILGNHDLGKKAEKAEAYFELVAEYDPATYADMIEMVRLASAEEKPYTMLTVDEFAQMKEAVDGLWTLSRTSKSSTIDDQRVSRDAIKYELANAVAALGNAPNKRGVKQSLSKMDEFKVTLLDWRAALSRVEHWVDLMDGGKPGPFRKYLWQPVSEAADRYRDERKSVMQKYLDLTEKYLSSPANPITSDPIDANLPGEIDYVFRNGKAELLGALLHTGNQSNLAKLLIGGRGENQAWGEFNDDGTLNTEKWDRFIKRMQDNGTLTKADYDFIQSVWDLMESLKPAAQAAHREMYGHYFDEITSNAFTTPWGTYKGGYAPAVTDPNLVTDAAARADEAALRPQMTFMFPTTGRGFTKSRIENYRKPLQLNLGLVPQHIDKVLRFTHIEPRVREVSRIALDKEFKANVASFVDTEVVSEMLVPWLERAAQQQVETPAVSRGMRRLDKVFRELRTRTGMQIMVGNVSNVLQQVTGLSSALLEVKPKFLRDSLASYLGAPNEVANEIATKSTFMRNRTTASVIEVQQAIDDIMLDPSKYDKLRAFATRHGYFLQQAAQNVVDIITWRGAYNEAIAGNLTERDAIRRADAAVRKTQGSFAAEDMSRFETGGATFRLFTMFYSYFNLQANLLGGKFAQAMRDGGFNAPGKLFYIYIFGVMIPAALAEAIAQAMSGDLWDDDDDDGYLDNFMSVMFGGQFKFATAMVPFIGQAANNMVNRFNDKPYDDKLSTSPVISILEATLRTPYSVYKAAFDDGSWKTAIKDSLTLAGIATGLPLGVLARPLGYAADVEQGKVEPANSADYIRGLISGRGPQ